MTDRPGYIGHAKIISERRINAPRADAPRQLPPLKGKGRGRPTRKPGEMTGLERKYAAHLEDRMTRGEIAEWMYEPVSLRLAPGRTFFKPDFLVMLPDGSIEYHETKGHMEEAAFVRLKVAAEKFYMFRFVLVKAKAKKDGGGFTFQEIG